MEAGSPADPRWPGTVSLAAWRLLRDGQVEASRALAAEAMAVSSTGSDLEKWGRCMVHETAMAVDVYSGRTNVEACEEWARLAHEIGDPYLEALGLTMLCVHRNFSGTDGCLDAGERGVAAARVSGSPTAIAYSEMSLAQALAASDPHRSVLLFDDAILMAESVDNDWAAGVCSAARGTVLTAWGDRPAAARALLESARRSQVGGNRTSMAQGLWGVASVLAAEGRSEGAVRLLGWTHAAAGSDMPAGIGAELIEAVRALPAVLGSKAYDELLQAGAGLDDEQVMTLAAAEVEELAAVESGRG
jgi:hypothetical protein